MYENIAKVIDEAIAEKNLYLSIYKSENEKLKQECEELKKQLEATHTLLQEVVKGEANNETN